MEGDFITRREHEEFARRMDDEDAYLHLVSKASSTS